MNMTSCVIMYVLFAVSFDATVPKSCPVVRGKDSNLVCNTERLVDSDKVSLYEFEG